MSIARMLSQATPAEFVAAHRALHVLATSGLLNIVTTLRIRTWLGQNQLGDIIKSLASELEHVIDCYPPFFKLGEMQWVFPGVLAFETNKVIVTCPSYIIDYSCIVTSIFWTDSDVISLHKVSLEKNGIYFVFIPRRDLLIRKGIKHLLYQLFAVNCLAFRDCLTWTVSGSVVIINVILELCLPPLCETWVTHEHSALALKDGLLFILLRHTYLAFCFLLDNPAEHVLLLISISCS